MIFASHPASQGRSANLMRGWAIVIGLLLMVPSVLAQNSQSGSLADIARQIRAQKQGQSGAGTSTAQQVADELSEDENRNDDAPGGFKTYNAGDYTLWVPAPYKVSGHDDAGVVLEGPAVGSKRSLLMVGTPILLPSAANDDAFRDAATQFSHLYARNATCSKSTAQNRNAYECSLSVADVIGTRVSGNAWFLRSENTIYPVMCAASSDNNNRDSVNNQHSANKDNARGAPESEDQDARAIWQKCATAFQSIRPKDAKAPQATAQAGASDSGIHSVQTPGQPAAIFSNAPAGTIPAGYKVHPFHYCSGPLQCWDASVLVPTGAQLVSSDCKRYIFQTKVQGSDLLLMAGPAAGECADHSPTGPDIVRWNQLADPETKRAPGTYNTISSQVTKLDGKAATITTMHFRNGMTDWMGKRAEVESNGVVLVVGCMAQRDHFDDADAVCSTMIGSLQMP